PRVTSADAGRQRVSAILRSSDSIGFPAASSRLTRATYTPATTSPPSHDTRLAPGATATVRLQRTRPSGPRNDTDALAARRAASAGRLKVRLPAPRRMSSGAALNAYGSSEVTVALLVAGPVPTEFVALTAMT